MTDQPLIAHRAELEVLNAMLIFANVCDRLTIDFAISERHFGLPAHQAVFAAIVAAREAGNREEMSVASIAQAVRDDARCTRDEADMAMRHVEANPLVLVTEVRTHVQTLRDLEERRRWQKAGLLMHEAARTGDRENLGLADQLITDTATSLSESADRTQLADMVASWLEEDGDPGIPTGLLDLDRAIGGGLRPGDTTALGGWTGTGKTVLCDCILEHAARRGRLVHAYVNEMSFVDRALRMVARTGAAPYARLATRRLRPKDNSAVLTALGQLPFGVTDCSTWDVQRLARDLRARKWDLCCLDLLHNMPYRDTAELDRIVATLAAAARSAGTHLILVCHLNEERAKSDLLPAPVLRDIRGSGMVKNVCANVLMLHREQNRVDGVVQTEDDGLVRAVKHRHGPGGGALVRFDPHRMRFLERMPDGGVVHYQEQAA